MLMLRKASAIMQVLHSAALHIIQSNLPLPRVVRHQSCNPHSKPANRRPCRAGLQPLRLGLSQGR